MVFGEFDPPKWAAISIRPTKCITWLILHCLSHHTTKSVDGANLQRCSKIYKSFKFLLYFTYLYKCPRGRIRTKFGSVEGVANTIICDKLFVDPLRRVDSARDQSFPFPTKSPVAINTAVATAQPVIIITFSV